MLSSIIFWGSSTPARSVSYTDSLFLVVSAMTLAGLNTINLSQLNTFQQFILFLLILLGSAIFVSIAVVHVRRKAFERRFKSIVEDARQRRRGLSNSKRRPSLSHARGRLEPEVDGIVVRGRAIKSPKQSTEDLDERFKTSEQPTSPAHEPASVMDDHANQEKNMEDVEASPRVIESSEAGHHLAVDVGVSRRITFASPVSPTRKREHGRIFSMQGVGAHQDIQNHPSTSSLPIYLKDLPRLRETNSDRDLTSRHDFLAGASVGRNSQFSNLTLAERERLGGVEYRAVTVLAVIVPLYFVLWQLFGCIGLGAYIATNRASATAVNAENPW